MAKDDVVSSFVDAVEAGQKQVLVDQGGTVYDNGFNDGVASVPVGSDGGFSQADLDAAKAQGAADQKVIDDQALSDQKAADDAALQAKSDADAQALADAQKAGSDAIAAVQKSLEDMTAKEQLEEQAVADVATKIEQVQAAFDAIKALFLPPAPPSG